LEIIIRKVTISFCILRSSQFWKMKFWWGQEHGTSSVKSPLLCHNTVEGIT
jgi:hypothetical protein